MTDPVTDTYNFTGDWVRFHVPNPVSTLDVAVFGGAGGDGGSKGGRIQGRLRVQGGDDLYILVGEQGKWPGGQSGGAPTTGGGGPGGAGGHPSRNGGRSGGGASEIRLNSPTGRLLVCSGGAGGSSGDGGPGGDGGAAKGSSGTRAGGGTSNVATGGGQDHGGNGGTVASNPGFNGADAGDAISGRGGAGGHTSDDRCHGGGGGGGGYHTGGGGQAGKNGVFFGGGGGGGSSFVGGLAEVSVNDRNGSNGNGLVLISYDPDGDAAPLTPTDVKINGVDYADDMTTGATRVTIRSKVRDMIPSGWWEVTDNDVREVVLLSPYGDPGDPRIPITDYREVHVGTGVEATGGNSDVTVGGLMTNRLYHGRIYAYDSRGQYSAGYTAITFWTNRPPDAPVLTSPGNNSEFDSTDTLAFDWTVDDPDGDTQSAYGFRLRFASTAKAAPSDWFTGLFPGAATAHSMPGSSVTPGRWYEWQAASADSGGLWSPWSESRTFYVNAQAIPPTPLAPNNGEAIYASEANLFEWRFNTQIADETQVTADLRYRPVGGDDTDWVTLTGDTGEPGTEGRWLIGAETFVAGFNYEWQARVHTSNTTISTWSESATFWATNLPVALPDLIPIDVTRMQEALGQYNNRVYVYKRGGQILVGEIAPIFDVQWGRKRDDMDSCTIHVNEWDTETRDMLRSLKPWAHELVVFRNGVRCWEGPITRISGNRETLEIEAKDVMAYVYRRILRQGYNDSYQIVAGQQIGLKTVVYRAQRIITNALIYDDPNVLPFLTPIHNPGDAIQSRIVNSYTKTAFDEVDDLAAHAGLDYSVAGRRIILNDTHRPIGRLPELSDGDFSDPPVVTVYGMTYATDFAVTNNNGYWGLAQRHDSTLEETGWIEQLASEYGESDPTGTGLQDLTPEEIAQLVATLKQQAERNIAQRFPMPVVVRVPDNSSLDPSVNLGINQLIPGVWAPLRCNEGLVQASQWQKLDSMTVRQDKDGEKITVVFSPAPNAGADPDDVADEEG